MESKNLNSHKHRAKWWLTGAGGGARWGDVVQRVQASNVKVGGHGHLQSVSPALWLRPDKFTQTTESCGEKGTARPFSQEESAPNPALSGFYCFSGHITLRMVLIYYAQVCCRWLLLQKTKERMLLITSKRKDIYKCKGKSG